MAHDLAQKALQHPEAMSPRAVEDLARAVLELEAEVLWLRKYARHALDCPTDNWNSLVGKCNCGFETSSTPPKEPK